MRHVVWVVVVVLGVALAGCRVEPGSTQAIASRSYGAALYTERCEVCHGAQGEGLGKVGNAIGNPEFLATASDEFLETAIAQGRPGTTMVPWAENGLNTYQIRSLVRFMRTWQKTPSVGLDPTKVAQGDRARGEGLYAQHCASCHGPQGDPGRDPNLVGNHLSNPVFLAQASDAFLIYATAYGRTGTTMQAFSQEKGGPLDAQQIEDVVTYIRSLQK